MLAIFRLKMKAYSRYALQERNFTGSVADADSGPAVGDTAERPFAAVPELTVNNQLQLPDYCFGRESIHQSV
jgi:hypothetical protein